MFLQEMDLSHVFKNEQKRKNLRVENSISKSLA